MSGSKCYTCEEFRERIANAERRKRPAEVVDAWRNALALHMGMEHGQTATAVL